MNCESDFVAKTADFTNLVKELAMQVAAADPKYVSRDQVPAAEIEKEKEIFRAQLAEQKKPANVIEKIIEGKLDSFFERICLLDQVSVRDQAQEGLADDRARRSARPARTSRSAASPASSSARARSRR